MCGHLEQTKYVMYLNFTDRPGANQQLACQQFH